MSAAGYPDLHLLGNHFSLSFQQTQPQPYDVLASQLHQFLCETSPGSSSSLEGSYGSFNMPQGLAALTSGGQTIPDVAPELTDCLASSPCPPEIGLQPQNASLDSCPNLDNLAGLDLDMTTFSPSLSFEPNLLMVQVTPGTVQGSLPQATFNTDSTPSATTDSQTISNTDESPSNQEGSGVRSRRSGTSKDSTDGRVKCGEPGCGTRVKSLSQHNKRCHQGKTHRCTICGKAFKTGPDCRRHEKNHLGKRLKCPFCPTMITGNRTDNLQRHILRKHGAVACKS
ncbi:hypothetical protein QBC46DRAFT_389759 [Diplogelasinospora grovesii]|uniref:C2H2-type domain-containing protein n=1 Tax=Diplogelasinospora grovesii TaxID=303347 RepID=A0AAN6S2F8_9PEZI|nr:hypothetical protein QBC46DRAFT_389759 [Diplogelasinospora grovesii]